MSTRVVTVEVHQPQPDGGGTIIERYFHDAGSFAVSDGYLHISSPDGIIAIFPPGAWKGVAYDKLSVPLIPAPGYDANHQAERDRLLEKYHAQRG